MLVAEPQTAAVPKGFRRNVDSGLILPADKSRQRIVITRDAWKLLDRVAKVLKRHEVSILLRCDRDTCRGAPLQATRLLDGSFRLRCEHADRICMRDF